MLTDIVVDTHEQMNALQGVADERHRQDVKWGITNHPLDTHFRVLVEEVGEVAKALNEKDTMQHLYDELIQVAACAVKMAEDIVTHHGKGLVIP